MNWGTISSRTAWIFVVAFAIFEGASGVLFFAAAGWSWDTITEPARLVGIGARGADLIRAACLLDMFGYVSAVPLAIYLRQRYRESAGIDFFTLCGILALTLGALAAVMFAFGAAPLIREYASGNHSVAPTFAAIHRIVFSGLWQTLDGFPAATWTLGVGRVAWKQGPRPLAVVLFALAAISIGSAAAHISGIVDRAWLFA